MQTCQVTRLDLPPTLDIGTLIISIMGCVQSQPEASPAGVSPPSQTRKEKQETTTPSSNTASKSNITTTNGATPYETQSTASFSEDGNTVAYFGLLKNDGDGGKVSKVAVEGDRKSRVCVVGISGKDDSSKVGMTDMDRVVRVEGVAMTMRWVVLVERRGDGDEKVVEEIVGDVMRICDENWNVYNGESEISKVNEAKPGKKIKISQELSELFQVVDKMVEVSQGRFDPTVGSVKAKVAHILAKDKRPPTLRDLEHLKHAVGWKKCLSSNSKTQIVTKRNGHTMIDLNGIAKGYTVDCVCRNLKAAGYASFYVDWAGDISTAGRHPSGRSWRTAIMNPPAVPHLFSCWQKDELHNAISNDDVAYLFDMEKENDKLGQLAICTSGDYFNVMKYGFHHIAHVDRLCQMKVAHASIGSVTVVASECFVADALATAAMTCDTVVSAKHFLKNLSFELADMLITWCIIGRDGSKEVSSGFNSQKELNGTPTENGGAKTAQSGVLTKRDGMHCAPRTLGFLKLPSNGSCQIDSLRTLSLDPVPLVSFVVADESEHCRILRGGKRDGWSFQYTDGAAYELSIRQIIDVPMAALVVAEISRISCDIEACMRPSTLNLAHGTTFVPFDVEFGSLRKPLPALEVVDAVKAIERRAPSAVWLAVTCSAEGESHALTATSTVVSKECPELLVLNVSLNTMFRAALGGMGSKITAYSLRSGLEDFADFHTEKSTIRNNSLQRLNEMASVVTARVNTITEIADHALIAAEIDNVANVTSSAKQLMWHDGQYMTI